LYSTYARSVWLTVPFAPRFALANRATDNQSNPRPQRPTTLSQPLPRLGRHLCLACCRALETTCLVRVGLRIDWAAARYKVQRTGPGARGWWCGGCAAAAAGWAGDSGETGQHTCGRNTASSLAHTLSANPPEAARRALDHPSKEAVHRVILLLMIASLHVEWHCSRRL